MSDFTSEMLGAFQPYLYVGLIFLGATTFLLVQISLRLKRIVEALEHRKNDAPIVEARPRP